MERLGEKHVVSESFPFIGPFCNFDREGNGTPLRYSCLENPWTEEPGGLQSMGSLGVGHD